ncbi:MAG: methyl-accepting chemotaxis protein, partial [Microcoleaceae cyanobacterium]
MAKAKNNLGHGANPKNNQSENRNQISSAAITQVREQSEQISNATNHIAQFIGQVAEGAESQIKSLDQTFSGINQMSASLKETANQAESVGTSTEE